MKKVYDDLIIINLYPQLFKDIYPAFTGCPVNWYPLSISIPDFPDGPMKKS